MFTDDGRLVLRQVVPSEVRSCGECRSVQSCCWLQTTIGDVEIVGRLLLPVSVLVVTVTSNIGVPIIIILRKTPKRTSKEKFLTYPPKNQLFFLVDTILVPFIDETGQKIHTAIHNLAARHCHETGHTGTKQKHHQQLQHSLKQ